MRSLYAIVMRVLLLCFLVRWSFADSIISRFTDTDCKDSLDSLYGPNGYPNGTCTDLRAENKTYGSFQVVRLDSGCAVTIYQNDTDADICSGFALEVQLQPVVCYNSSWAYYSIDECDPTAQSTSAAATTSTAPAKKNTSTGAIVGGTIGGVLGLALLAGVLMFIYRKRIAKKKEPGSSGTYHGVVESDMTDVHELSTDGPKEMPAVTSGYQDPAKVEPIAPVELAGHGV